MIERWLHLIRGGQETERHLRNEIASLQFEVDTLKATLRRESARDHEVEIEDLKKKLQQARHALAYCYEQARNPRAIRQVVVRALEEPAE